MAQRPTRPILGDAGIGRIVERLTFAMRSVIVGQDRLVDRVLVSLLAGGHCLLEGPPGLAKTLTVETLARVTGCSFARIQFTPDLLPSDVVGTRIFLAAEDRFSVELGPVFANLVLADEVNRAPPKVQSALLEVMSEHQVTIGGVTHRVPEPFFVLATQNPIESEGVYPLPEAQQDRFLFKLAVTQPGYEDELEIARRMLDPPGMPEPVASPDVLAALQRETTRVYVDPVILDYAVRLVMATREPERFGAADLAPYLALGASPRATLGLLRGARALALLRGRRYVLPADIAEIAPDVLRHRVVLSYEAVAEDLDPEEIVAGVLAGVPAPRVVTGSGS